MAILRKRKTKLGFVYDIDFTVDGRRIIRSTQTSDKKLANQILDEIRGKIVRGKFDLADYSNTHINLEAYFLEYFNRARLDKSPGTIKNETQYATAFTEYMHNCNLDAIDLRAVEGWKDYMLTRKKKTMPDENISPATFNIQRRFLKAAFNQAVKQKYIKKNPFQDLKEVPVQEKRLYLKHDEMDTILRLIEEDIEKAHIDRQKNFLRRFRILIEFLANTGLRRQEALDLDWRNIDLKRDEILIEHTKTRRTRIVPLNDVSRNCIEEIGENLFHSFDARHVTRKFHSYVERANIKGMKLHSLRHTFATNLFELREDSATIQKLLGHSDIRTTLRYAKVSDEMMRNAVAKLSVKEPKICKTFARLLVLGEGVNN